MSQAEFDHVRNQEIQDLPLYYNNHESLMDLFREVDALVTQPFNDLKGLIAKVKEKFEEFLEAETAFNDQHD